MRTIRALSSVFIMQMKLSLERSTFRFCCIAQPILYCLLLYYIYYKSDRNITVIILSSMLVTLWSCLCFSSIGDIQRERDMGTLNYIYCCPVPFMKIVLVKSLSNTILGLSSIIIIWFVAQFILKVNLIIANPFYFSITILLVIISFLSLSLLIASFFLLSRENLAWVDLFQYPLYIACGMVVPVTYFPKYIRGICYIFPPTRAIELFNSSIVGIDFMSNFWCGTVISVIHSIIFIISACLVIKKLDKKMRINNTGGLI